MRLTRKLPSTHRTQLFHYFAFFFFLKFFIVSIKYMPHQSHKKRHRWFSDPLQFALTQNKIKKKKVQRNICFQATKQASTWAQQILNINEKLNYKHNLKWIFLFLANQNYSLQVNLTTLSPISFWVITPFSKREIFPKNFSFKLFPTKVFFFYSIQARDTETNKGSYE